MTTFDKKYFKTAFDLGMLNRVFLCEAVCAKGWELEIEFSNKRLERLESRRGEQRVFKTSDAALKFAKDIGFKGLQITWD